MMSAKTAGGMDALRAFDVAKHMHGFELAGLGALAIPTLYHGLKHDADNTDRLMSGVELGGLGALAAPSLAHILGH
jgi:hypothetical protein